MSIPKLSRIQDCGAKVSCVKEKEAAGSTMIVKFTAVPQIILPLGYMQRLDTHYY